VPKLAQEVHNLSEALNKEKQQVADLSS